MNSPSQIAMQHMDATSAVTDESAGVTLLSESRSLPKSLLVLGMALCGLAVLVVGFAGYLIAITPLQQASAQANLYSDLGEQLKTATAPVAAPLPVGRPVALLEIPSLGMSQVVVESSTSENLRLGPAHRTDSAIPGQIGSSVILGRRATYGAPFRALNELKTGDAIVVTTGQGRFTYTVDVVRLSDQSYDAMPIVPARLTLVTSDPALTPERSLIVSAALTEGDAQPRVGTALPAGPAQQPLQGDPNSSLALALWAQALLGVVILGVLARRRLPASVVWVAFVPLTLVAIWNVYESLAAVLPNTL